MKKINLILSFILLNTIVFPAYAVDDGETKFIIQQDVGIKTKNPAATLHLNGTGLFEDGGVTFSNTSPVTFNSLALVNSNLQIPTGAAPGFVLVSNATGVASWADPTTVTSAGDNLGDHLATQTLNMGNNNISTVNKIGIKTPNPTADVEIISNNLNNGGILVSSTNPIEFPILRGPGRGTGITNIDSFRILQKSDYLGTVNDYLIIDKTDGNDPNPDGGIVFTNTGNDGIREVSLAIRGDGFIGVGTNTQAAKFDIGGGIRNFIDGIDDLLVKDDVEVDGSIYVQDDLILTKNPGAGKILISDKNGKAMWTVPAMVQTNGDNMGNHTANRNLDMSSHDITSVKNITATSFNGGTFNGTFKGDGSGLTNVKSPVFKILANTILNNGSLASYANNFLIGSPSMDDSGNSSHDSKLFFNKAKGAFRAGKVEGNEWNDINVGQNSVAFGKNTRASGENSFAVGNGSVATQLSSLALGSNSRAIGTYGVAIGFNTLANDDFAVALGTSTEARGKRSTAFGHFSKATGFLSTAFGNGTLASGITSIAFGQEAQATNVNSIAIGKNVRSSGNQSFTIGSGNSNLDMLTNSINNSLAIGFATNQPTLFVGPGTGGATDGKVGIGTNTPQDLLDVDGRLRTQEFRMPTGAANNFVLTSDGVGVGTWKSLATIGGTGDNLGDHKATQTLDMVNNDLKDVKNLNVSNIITNNTSPGANATRLYAQVPASGGWADFVTVSRQGPGLPLNNKWAVGSTGDTRSNSDGGQNSFYVFQHTNKNDVNVNGYRLSIDDNGFVGIGLALAKSKLDVGGGVRNFIDGIDDILVKDDIEVDGTVFTSGLRMPTGAANNLVLTSDATGNATWKSLATLPGNGDNLGDHKATQTLDMDNNDIKDVKYLNAVNILTHNNAPGAFGTRLYSQIPSAAGYADFVTVSRQTPTSPLIVKWAVGSTGDTRDISDGGGNTFYIHQKTNKNDVAVNGYRLAIDDTGLVGIGLHNPKAKLDVGGGVRNFIDGIDDLLVKDDVEVDGTVFTSGFRMPTGAANNLVLTSDATGNATWKSLGAIGGAGDDLGNHIATTHLNMATRNIINAGTIIAANFGGSGGGITNINAANISTGVLHIDRIPNIPASKLASLSLDDLTDGITFTSNVFLGDGAGENGVTATAIWNTAVGFKAGNAISTGTRNVAIGATSMSGNYLGARGSKNTAIGTSALLGAGLAEENTALGYRAGHSIVDGDKNIAIGVEALMYADGPNANENIAIGYRTGYNMNEGRSNILIGNRTDVQSTYSNFTGANNIFIGNNIVGSSVTMSNTLNIGNLIYGGLTSKSVNIDGSLEADRIKLTTGAGAGRVLTSDATGNATWQSASSGADNLGNHQAAQHLYMNNFSIVNAGDINAQRIRLSTGAGLNKVLTSDTSGNATWENPPGSDNLGNHRATQTLNMNNQDIKRAGDINGEALYATKVFARNTASGAFGSRVYAEIPREDGYSEFVTSSRGADYSILEKWSVGSTGNNRPTTNGHPNAFYIHQWRNKNNVRVDQYRLHINDDGNVKIGGVDATEKLEVDGRVKATGLQITANAGAGRVLTSDAAGNATWQAASGGGGGGGASDLIQRGTGNRSIIINTFLGDPTLAPVASGMYAVTWGSGTKARGEASLAIGLGSVANGTLSFAVGNVTRATAQASAAFNSGTRATGLESFATGSYTRASGQRSATFGSGGEASGASSVKFGEGGLASGNNSAVFGLWNTASGEKSFAIGESNQAIGMNSFVTGYDNEVSGYSSVAIGRYIKSTSPNVGGSLTSNITIGTGAGALAGMYLENNTGDSFAVGFNSNRPTLMVTRASGVNTIGRVGIGTTAPTHTLTVMGDASKSVGGTAWVVASDERLKNVHGKYEYGLKEILQLDTVRFSYKKDNARSLPSDSKEIGFVAQEVQKVIPEAITQAKDGYLEFNIHPVNVAMVNAIQELKKEKDAEIKDLKEQVSLLKKLYCLDHASTELCK